jgi:hypothetical protein
MTSLVSPNPLPWAWLESCDWLGQLTTPWCNAIELSALVIVFHISTVPASLHARPANWPRCADTRQWRAYSQALAQAKTAYEQAAGSDVLAEQWRKDLLVLAQAAHRQSADRERQQVRRQHDQMAREFAYEKRKAVTDYFRGCSTCSGTETTSRPVRKSR